MRTPGRFGRVVLAIGVPFVLAVLAAEGFVRARSEYITPEILQARSLSYEPAVFARHVLTPEVRDLTGPGPEQQYRINEFGYRGPDFPWKKPPGGVRVIIYGGSTVFDIDGREGEDWPSLVERNLRERGFAQIEVINAGVPGHASFESLGRFFAEGHLLQPDVVVLYDQWNDLKLFRETTSLLRTLEPYRRDGDLRYAYRNGLDRALCRSSQLYVRLRARFINRTLAVDAEGRTSRELQEEFGPEGPQQFRLSVATFIDAVRNAGAVPIVVHEARLVDAANEDEERRRVPLHYHGLTHSGLVRAYTITDSILADVARTKQAVLVDASTGVSGASRHFTDYVHLNREGAAVVSARVADAVAAVLTSEAPFETGVR